MDNSAAHETRPRAAKYQVTDDDWIIEFLKAAPIASIAVADDGQPYINTNLYWFDEKQRAVYLHTAVSGRLKRIVQTHPNASLTVFELGRFIPDRRPLKFSAEYCAVVGFGQLSVVDNDREKEIAMNAILEKYAPHLQKGTDYDPISLSDLNATTVFKFEIDALSGKGKRRRVDYPGAYEPPASPVMLNKLPSIP